MRRQGCYWILTIKEESYSPQDVLPRFIKYIKGQLEEGQGGFRHWQLYAITEKASLQTWKSLYPDAHVELSRSTAAEKYVEKEHTRVEGSQFEIGSKPLKRNDKKDWLAIRVSAQSGDLGLVPDDVFVR